MPDTTDREAIVDLSNPPAWQGIEFIEVATSRRRRWARCWS